MSDRTKGLDRVPFKTSAYQTSTIGRGPKEEAPMNELTDDDSPAEVGWYDVSGDFSKIGFNSGRSTVDGGMASGFEPDPPGSRGTPAEAKGPQHKSDAVFNDHFID